MAAMLRPDQDEICHSLAEAKRKYKFAHCSSVYSSCQNKSMNVAPSVYELSILLMSPFMVDAGLNQSRKVKMKENSCSYCFVGTWSLISETKLLSTLWTANEKTSCNCYVRQQTCIKGQGFYLLWGRYSQRDTASSKKSQGEEQRAKKLRHNQTDCGLQDWHCYCIEQE